MMTPALGSLAACSSMATCLAFLLMPVLPGQRGVISPQVAQVKSVDAWDETRYLQSIPGVAESIQKGLATPTSELIEIDEAELLGRKPSGIHLGIA